MNLSFLMNQNAAKLQFSPKKIRVKPPDPFLLLHACSNLRSLKAWSCKRGLQVSDLCDTPEKPIYSVEKSLNLIDEYLYEPWICKCQHVAYLSAITLRFFYKQLGLEVRAQLFSVTIEFEPSKLLKSCLIGG